MPGNTLASNEFEFCKFTRVHLTRFSIGLKTISHCQNSHMRIIVNQSL